MQHALFPIQCCFCDKEEWAQALAVLQQEGVLTRAVETDTITLSVATMEVDA